MLFEDTKKIERLPLEPGTVFNAIFWMLASGARWRDLPARYAYSTLLEIDSTFCKVQSQCLLCAEEAIVVSRGGNNTKVHVLINDRMQLLNVVLSGGNIHDSDLGVELLAGVDLNGKDKTHF